MNQAFSLPPLTSAWYTVYTLDKGTQFRLVQVSNFYNGDAPVNE